MRKKVSKNIKALWGLYICDLGRLHYSWTGKISKWHRY